MSEQESQVKPIVLDPEKCTRQAMVGGFVFAGIYVLAGIFLLSRSGDNEVVGVFCLLDAGLFLFGSILALTGKHSPARVIWLIAGILGLPLGLVMVVLANRMNAAIKAAAQARSEQAAALPLAETPSTPAETMSTPATLTEGEPERKRPANVLRAGIYLIVLGIIVAIGGIPYLLDSSGIAYLLNKIGITGYFLGGVGTGSAIAALGVLLSALSFARLPNVPDAPPPMSTFERLAGIFYEPTMVFRNLRAHPRWLAAILVIGVLNAAYINAFYRRVTPEVIVNFTVDKLAESPIFTPPPELLAKMRAEGIEQAKSPIFQAGNVVRMIVSAFFGVAIIGALYLLGVLAFGGRMHFWQAFSVAAYASFPLVVIQRVLSFIILFLKSPDDIHPLIDQETLVHDNLGLLFAAKDHPVLYVAASAIGILSFYKLWLIAKGLNEGGYKVSSSAGWGVAITLWVLALLFGLAIAAIFPGFLS